MSNTAKKSTRKRNGVPSYKPKDAGQLTVKNRPRESTFIRLLSCPLNQHSRAMRLIRKLNLQPRAESTAGK